MNIFKTFFLAFSIGLVSTFAICSLGGEVVGVVFGFISIGIFASLLVGSFVHYSKIPKIETRNPIIDIPTGEVVFLSSQSIQHHKAALKQQLIANQNEQWDSNKLIYSKCDF